MRHLASLSVAVAVVAILLLLFIAPVITVAAAQAGPAADDGTAASLDHRAR